MRPLCLEHLFRAILVSTFAVGAAHVVACGGSEETPTGSTSPGVGGSAGAGGSSAQGGGAGLAGAAGAAGASGTAGEGGAGSAGEGGAAGVGGSSGGAGAAGSGGDSGAAGAAGAAGAPPIDTTGYDDAACMANPVASLSAQLGLDGIQLWRRSLDNTGWELGSSDGSPCSTAADAIACQAAVAQATTPDAPTSLNSGHFFYKTPELIVTTKGDAVVAVTSNEQLLVLLGKIDSTEKALLWLRYSFQYGFPCPLKLKKSDDGYLIVADVTINDCPDTSEQQLIHLAQDGKLDVLVHGQQTDGGGCAGRRPEGLAPSRVASGDELGAFLARVGYLEAASVDAFLRLRDELAALGAPPELLGACVEAAQDEVRHAAQMGRLAVSRGARAGAPTAASIRKRSIQEIAIENMAEGCVRETFGALVAALQAERAGDGALRAAMPAIARDEARHAALSWRVNEFLLARLDGAGRRAVAAAKRRAMAELERELSVPRPSSLEQAAGLPDAATAARLFGALSAALWAGDGAAPSLDLAS
jgi:hypothetical protein